MMETYNKNAEPIDDRLEICSLKRIGFLVFDIFKNIPDNYYKKDGQIFNTPLELSEINFILFNGNLKGVFYDKDPHQVFIGQDIPGGGVENITEVHRGDCFVFNPPFILTMQRKLIDEFFIDILPRLKAMGFLDANVRNPGISTAGIARTLQFGNALPSLLYKYKDKTNTFVLKNRISKKKFHPLFKIRGFRNIVKRFCLTFV